MTLYIIRPDNNVLDAVHLHLSKLHPEKSFDVTIEPHKAKRTLQQNAYLHVLVKIWLKENEGFVTENNLEQKKRQLAFNLAIFEMFSGQNGERMLFPKRTQDMSVSELNQMIEEITKECDGYKLPAPKYYGYE